MGKFLHDEGFDKVLQALEADPINIYLDLLD